MKEKSIYNMIISIISASLVIPIMVLGIIFSKNTLSTVLECIYLPILISYLVIKSIYFAKSESTSKEVLKRLSKCILDVVTTLIVVEFTLLLHTPFKWILFSILLLICILELLLDSINKLVEVKYLLSVIKIALFIFALISNYLFSFISICILLAIFIEYISNLLGSILNNKTLLSFEIIAIILFGVFLIFI